MGYASRCTAIRRPDGRRAALGVLAMLAGGSLLPVGTAIAKKKPPAPKVSIKGWTRQLGGTDPGDSETSISAGTLRYCNLKPVVLIRVRYKLTDPTAVVGKKYKQQITGPNMNFSHTYKLPVSGSYTSGANKNVQDPSAAGFLDGTYTSTLLYKGHVLPHSTTSLTLVRDPSAC